MQAEFDPSQYYAVGGSAEIIARAEDYKRAGVSKFVLSTLADNDDDLISQTQRLIDEVVPVVHD